MADSEKVDQIKPPQLIIYSNITASELLESDLRNRVLSVCPFDIKIYQFKDEIEAVDFYIEFNKNITHSKDDIRRAEQYRKAIL